MRPVLFAWGDLEIASYAVMLSLGACAGFWMTVREARRKGSDAHALLTLAVIAFASGLAGARGLSWALSSDLHAGRPWWHVLQVWESGGMSLYGGLVFASAAGLAWIAATRLPAWDSADTLAVAWTPFVALARVGCFLNGCCYGRPTTSPIGMIAGSSFDAARFGIPSHPAQLYAIAALCGIFVVLLRLRKRRRYEGQIALTFLVLYGVFTFFHELVRGDARPLFPDSGSFPSINQAVSAVIVLAGLTAGWILARRGRRKSESIERFQA